MTAPRLHFLFESKKPESVALAERLIDGFGQTSLKDADILVSVGGDGLLLQALREGRGKSVYGLTPKESNSRGFWTDHSVTNAQDLRERLAAARKIRLVPLQGRVRFANGREKICYAFNDIAIERASGQSALINLTTAFQQESAGPYRIMGDGFVFSTALGSTGTSRSYGGPAIDVSNRVIIMTGKGVFDPRGLSPVVTGQQGTSFSAEFGSATHKRPVRIDYDGHSISGDEDGSPVTGLTVKAAPARAANLLLTKDPGLRAITAMMP